MLNIIVLTRVADSSQMLVNLNNVCAIYEDGDNTTIITIDSSRFYVKESVKQVFDLMRKPKAY